uniref:Putative secreted peptide n=1 Tax=Anopheles braziliensis TaxID=58242 RepID=A0A2M3ZRR2_9DIPT
MLLLLLLLLLFTDTAPVRSTRARTAASLVHIVNDGQSPLGHVKVLRVVKLIVPPLSQTEDDVDRDKDRQRHTDDR